jgi:hypothetical protein
VRTPWQRTAIGALLRHCPAVLLAHVARKLSRVVRGLPPADIDPSRFSAPYSPRAKPG